MKKTLFFLLILVAGTLNGTSQAVSRIQFSNHATQTAIPIEINNNLIFLQCSVNQSRPGWFIFDTGAGFTLLDSTFAVENNLSITDSIISKISGRKVPGSGNLTFTLNEAHLTRVSARVTNTFQLSSMVGRKIDGIIGYDFLDQFVVEIDYAGKFVKFIDPGSFSYQGKGTPLTIALNKANWPTARVALYGNGQQQEGTIILDSGSLTGLSLSSGALAGVTIPYPFSFGINGAGGGSRMGRIDTCLLAGYSIHGGIAGFPEQEASQDADDITRTVSESGLGLIGSDLMKQFTWTFDYSRKIAYVEPNNRWGEPFEFDMSGLTIITIDEAYATFMVLVIIPGSPAEQSGLQPGDIILEIDGFPASKYSLSELRQLFKNDNKTFRLKIRRNDSTLDISLTTRKMI